MTRAPATVRATAKAVRPSQENKCLVVLYHHEDNKPQNASFLYSLFTSVRRTVHAYTIDSLAVLRYACVVLNYYVIYRAAWQAIAALRKVFFKFNLRTHTAPTNHLVGFRNDRGETA